MSATSATLPRRDTAGAGHRPLSAIAAAASGGVPQARILRVLADVAGPLADWHAQGHVHGAVAMSTIGLDSSGRAHLLAPPLAPAADAEGAVRIRGYAAFEQYTDDPERPCGPWTDVYALSAVAHALVVGAPPPDALARCVKDAYVPLQGRDVGAYDAGFLQAIDRGLSMTHGARPADMQACAQAFGFALAQPVPPEPQAAPVEPEPDLPPVAAPPRAVAGPRVPLLVMLGVLAAVALAVYLWLRPGAPGSQSAGRAASPVEPAPEPAPVPAPPALADLNAPRSSAPQGQGAGGPPAPEGSVDAEGAPSGSASSDGLVRGADGVLAPPSPDGSATPAGPGPANPDPALPGDGDAPGVAGTTQPPSADEAAAAPGGVSDPAGGASDATGATTAPDAPGADGTVDPAQTEGEEPGDTAAGEPTADDAEPVEPVQAAVPVRVHVRPWGEVMVDGRSRGISPPLTQLTLPPGRHRITIRNPAAPEYNTTIEVKPGGAASISHVFE